MKYTTPIFVLLFYLVCNTSKANHELFILDNNKINKQLSVLDPLEEMLVSDPQNQTVSSYIDGHDIGKTLGPDKDDPAMKYLYGGAAFCAGFCCWGPGVWGVVQASSHDKNLTELAVIGSVISYSLTVLFTIVTIYADTW